MLNQLPRFVKSFVLELEPQYKKHFFLMIFSNMPEPSIRKTAQHLWALQLWVRWETFQHKIYLNHFQFHYVPINYVWNMENIFSGMLLWYSKLPALGFITCYFGVCNIFIILMLFNLTKAQIHSCTHILCSNPRTDDNSKLTHWL